MARSHLRREAVAAAQWDGYDRAMIDLLRPGSNALRGVLLHIETAIRAGGFAGEAMEPKRIALLNALAELGDSQLSQRVAVRYARVYALITGSNHAP
jgi:hypothetical protein